MHPVLTATMIRAWDRFTMEHEPVASWALMERAVAALRNIIRTDYPPARHPVTVLCGPGNNGGDGLGLARWLARCHYRVRVILAGESATVDHARNLALLSDHPEVGIWRWPDRPCEALPGTLWVDCLLGTGCTGALRPPFPDILAWLADQPGIRISVDMPTGLPSEEGPGGACFPADRTLAFQVPRPSFFLPQSAPWLGDWEILDIGLHPGFPGLVEADTFLLSLPDLAPRLPKRARFAHKGQCGHALMIAGSTGMYGAARLSAEACLRSGCGKLTLHLPGKGVPVLQSALPEAMVRADAHQDCWSVAPDLAPYQAVGVGCGIGRNGLSARALKDLLHPSCPPLVLDADALNLLAEQPDLLRRVPEGSILTPHPGEFARLCPEPNGPGDPWRTQRAFCREYRVILIRKGAYSAIGLPDGRIYLNPTGNPGMATAGSGDVLTGILTGLLAQGHPPQEAAILGTYLHGLAGDLALAACGSEEALLAGDIIRHLGRAFQILHQHDRTQFLRTQRDHLHPIPNTPPA